MEEADKGIVCVTGATGYVASWLVMRLLQHGYSVRATVRSHSPGGKKDISFLTSLPRASQKLQIFTADLADPSSFDTAIDGCIGVFHVAHPIDFDGRELKKTLNESSINGTMGILKSCVKSKTVKRVIYTSSSSTVNLREEGEEEGDGGLEEDTWSDVGFISAKKPFGTPYYISKIVTERAVWEFAENHGLDVVSVIPPLIMGPFICPNVPSSVSMGLATIFGYEEAYEFLIKTSMVHIDDVASAHIFLFENPLAKGRYNCSTLDITIHELFEFLSSKYSEFSIPTAEIIKGIKGCKQKGLSSKKLLDSGFEFKYGLDEMFQGAIQCCKEKGFL